MSKQIEALKLALEVLKAAYVPADLDEQRERTIKELEALALVNKVDQEQPAPPPECQTEAEKTAFAFGWWKALEQKREDEQPAQQQEPMAWIERDMQCDDYDPDSVTCEKPDIAADGWEWVPLYTSPQSKPWVGLTEEEKMAALVSVDAETKRLPPGFRNFAHAIEAKLREKNNG